MRIHDALRRAFAKYGAYADPWTLMELEQFVVAAIKRGGEGDVRSLVDNVEAIVRRSEDPRAAEKARDIVDYVLKLCSNGCES